MSICICGDPGCWDGDDFSWLSSRSGLRYAEPDGGTTSIFFVHGKRIRHQAHIATGHHDIETFISMIRSRAEGLEDVSVIWSSDEDGASLWVDGTREPRPEDYERLEEARQRQLAEDRRNYADMLKRAEKAGVTL